VSAFVVGRRIRSVWSSLLCFSFVRFFFVCFHLFSLMEAVFLGIVIPAPRWESGVGLPLQLGTHGRSIRQSQLHTPPCRRSGVAGVSARREGASSRLSRKGGWPT